MFIRFKAKEQLKPDATAVYVAAGQAAAAIEEAVEAEIPLIVAVAEHIPLHDMLRVHSMLRSQSKSRLVGANSPGMISAVGKCRLGFHPLPTFQPGCVGIVAKSGTLSYETVASTTRAGVGQSLVIGMGGDPLPGTDFVDALRVFEHDDDTKGIILVGEIGGRAEDDAAEWIKEYRARTKDAKPIMALIGGIQAPSGRIMGHAGAYVGVGEKKAKAKIRALEDAGVVMTNHPSKFGDAMKGLLASSGITFTPTSSLQGQKRSIHTLRKTTAPSIAMVWPLQRRRMHLPERKAFDMLEAKGVPIMKQEDPESRDYFLTITFDRNAYQPCLITSYSIGGESPHLHAKSYLLRFGVIDLDRAIMSHIMSDFRVKLNLGDRGDPSFDSLARIVISLFHIFYEREASSLSIRISRDLQGQFEVARATFEFDDAAHRSKRHGDIQALRDTKDEVPEEVEAEKDGIVYIKSVFIVPRIRFHER